MSLGPKKQVFPRGSQVQKSAMIQKSEISIRHRISAFFFFRREISQRFPPKSLEIPAVLDLSGELRVSFAPSTVLKLRRMGFSILLETSAGASAGFSDEDYTRRGRTYGAHTGHQVGSGADVSQPVKHHCIFLY